MGATANLGTTTMGADGTSYSSSPVATGSIPSAPSAVNYGAMAGAVSITQGVGAIGSAYAQGNAAKLQGEYQAQQYEFNSHMSEIEAASTEYAGQQAAADELKQAGQVVGDQSTKYAANNVDVNSGSAAITEAQTEGKALMNAVIIRNNAYRQSLGLQIQATSEGTEAGMSEIAGNETASQTFLTGGLNAIAGGIQSAYYFGGGTGNIARTSSSGAFAWSGG